MTDENDFNWTIHPGIHWAEIISESGRTSYSVAEEISISAKHMSQICTGKALPSADATVAFARAMEVSPRMMWNLCCEYKLSVALGKIDLTEDYLTEEV